MPYADEAEALVVLVPYEALYALSLIHIYELALAMGVQVATARLGTAAALSASLPFAKAMGGVSASIGLGAALLCAGVLVYLVYCCLLYTSRCV